MIVLMIVLMDLSLTLWETDVEQSSNNYALSTACSNNRWSSRHG